jgi:hypothetical protein
MGAACEACVGRSDRHAETKQVQNTKPKEQLNGSASSQDTSMQFTSGRPGATPLQFKHENDLPKDASAIDIFDKSLMDSE